MPTTFCVIPVRLDGWSVRELSQEWSRTEYDHTLKKTSTPNVRRLIPRISRLRPKDVEGGSFLMDFPLGLGIILIEEILAQGRSLINENP